MRRVGRPDGKRATVLGRIKAKLLRGAAQP